MKKLHGFLVVVSAIAPQVFDATQHAFICGKRWLAAALFKERTLDPAVQGRDDCLADFLGNSRHIVRGTIECVAPQLRPCRRVDKANCDTNAIADALQAALHHQTHTKALADFRGIGGELSDSQRRITVNDKQQAESSKAGNNVLGQAFT